MAELDEFIPFNSENFNVDGELVRGAGLHFFLEDYRFEAVWNRPGQALKGLRPYGAILTPDFSLRQFFVISVCVLAKAGLRC